VIKKKSRDTPEHDLFWVVYDREGVTKYLDSLHAKALGKANANSIGVALSNVCFEVWLLCHLECSTAQYSNFDDLKSRSNLDVKIRALGFPNGYTKCDKQICEKLMEKVDVAKENASKMNTAVIAGSLASNIYQFSPYTNIPDLLDAIDEAANP